MLIKCDNVALINVSLISVNSMPSKNSNKRRRFWFEISPSLKIKIMFLAKRKGVDVNQFIGKVIRDYLRRNDD
tara:strand:+ start:319 stop:537 length:219 start_codon:yes stop_codon:yes gene_type:complete